MQMPYEGEWHQLSRFWNPGLSRLPLIVMANLFCDESHDGHTYALAGWLATPDGWDAISGEWRQMLSDLNMPEFHAVEIVERDHITDSRFKGWTFDQEVAAFRRAVDILVDKRHCNELVAFGCAITVPRPEDEFNFESDNAIWYFLFCRFLPLLCRHFPDEREFNFVFDQKPEIREIVNSQYYAARQLVRKHRPDVCLGETVTFADSMERMPLQTADLFAYEWRKRISDLIRNPSKSKRRSYARLRDDRKSYLHHINRETWEDLQLHSNKDGSKFINLLLNCEGREED